MAQVIHDPWESDISAAPVVRRLLEKDVQKKCVDYARGRGYWARKFSSPANRSVPDYLFGKAWYSGTIKRAAVAWAEEFKAPKKVSTDAQTEEQDLMVAAGWRVIRDTGTHGQEDIDAFKMRIDALERKFS